MKECFRNCFHILMVPVWRRKYFLMFIGVVWAVFYIYVHYVSVSDNSSEGNDDSGAKVSLKTGSLSAKLPVDVDLVLPEKDSMYPSDNAFSGRRVGEIDSIDAHRTRRPIFSGKPIVKPIVSEKKRWHKSSVPPDQYDNTAIGGKIANVRNALIGSIHETNEKRSSNVDLTINAPNDPNIGKSLKERFSENGIKPSSVLFGQQVKVENVENVTQEATEPPPYIPPLRLVHFDLKGAPPKISYFKSIFPLLKAAGANGIIMEYEDTFPFWGSLSTVSSLISYKKRDIKYILELAKYHELEVIPLVQTFGHLEFILKLQEFKHLREVEDSPQALCPTNNGSLLMVKTMIDQVMSLHTDSKWLHIGSDEVFQLGHCKRCSRYDRNSLFLAYVRKVAKYVRDTYKIIPIMWDDMLRHISVPELEKYELGKLVEPMAWTYVEDVYLFIPDSLWEKYGQVFPHIWTASAYKGAFGETLTVPDAKRHLENNKAWLSVMKDQHKNFKSLRGIALTGWQRYDHFAALCELLPASLPSLIITLLTVSQGAFDDTIFPKLQEILDCSSRKHYHLDLDRDPYMWRALGICFFPGSSVFRLTLRHNDVTKSIEKYIYDTTVHKGWLTEYNSNHNFTSPMRVNELLREFSYHNSTLQMLLEAATKALREMFDDYTVNEWIELNIYPLVKKMKMMWEEALRLKKFDVWPRRPFSKVVKLPPPSTDFGFIKS